MKRIILISLISFVVCSCDILDDNYTEPLQVAPSSITLYVGDEYQIQTNYRDGVAFRSQDNWYASVSSTGLVKGKSLGKTTIQVSKDGYTSSVNVKVESKYDLYPLMDNFIGKPISTAQSTFGVEDETTRYEDATIYWYHDYGKYDLHIAFAVETNDASKIVGGVLVYASVLNYTAFSTYIWDRYFCPKVLNDVYYLYNHDKTISLRWEYLPEQAMYGVAYYPYVNEYD